MDIEQIKRRVIETAVQRDRRRLCHQAILLSEMLAAQGNSPELIKAQAHIERALELALSVVR